MEATAQNIVSNPATFGVSFVSDEVSKKEGAVKVSLGFRSLLVVADVATFRKMVPTADAVITSHLDGQSVRVAAQNIVRTALLRDRKTPDESLMLRQVESIIMGARAARLSGPKTWKTPAGTFTDRTEAVAQTAAWFIDSTGMDGDTAKTTAAQVVAAQD